MFAERFRAAREAAGLTQYRLAALLGISSQQVNRWDKSDTAPNGETLKQICRVLNVSADYLLELSDDMTSNAGISDLYPDELKVSEAMRRGDLLRAIRIIVEK